MACSLVIDPGLIGEKYKHAYFPDASTLAQVAPKLAYMGKTLAERLIEARVASGFAAPKAAADKAGITPSALYQLENGTTKSLRAETAHKLALVYSGFRIEWLINGSGPSRATENQVSDSAASYRTSHALRIDPEIIASAIKLVRLSFENLGLEFDNEQDGVPLAFAYTYLLEREQSEVSLENLVDFSKKLAERLKDRGNDETAGSDTGRTGRGHRAPGEGRKAG